MMESNDIITKEIDLLYRNGVLTSSMDQVALVILKKELFTKYNTDVDIQVLRNRVELYLK